MEITSTNPKYQQYLARLQAFYDATFYQYYGRNICIVKSLLDKTRGKNDKTKIKCHDK